MDTRFIESLIAVGDYGSIVAAARAQALTPAAVSQPMQVLERELGVPLLLRRICRMPAAICCPGCAGSLR